MHTVSTTSLWNFELLMYNKHSRKNCKCHKSIIQVLLMLVLPSAHEAKSGVKQLIQFCPSINPQTSVYDRGATWFQLNVTFWTLIGKRTCSLVVLWLWIWPDRACSMRSETMLFLLSVWQSDKIENHSKQETCYFWQRHKGHKQQARRTHVTC